ncbi:Fumitremorgin C synthase [Cytospora mali]|uniref:Fumitremorgin C synthase n=1 Tax=Cytospora mali TaxID=578113 RepID=A0A194V8A6_CYTMA|nr:Fumitremorgin C synthase [Valsa mali var. pyri (nom. inval.)]
MVSQLSLLLVGLATILLVQRSLRYFLRGPNPSPLPPGPPGLPIIGNLHQMPKSRVWLQWHAWGKKYGPVVFLNMLGQPIVILHSAKAAQDLLARRGAIYSDRPRLVLAGELALKGLHLLLMPYDAQYKIHQKMEAPLLTPRAAISYRPLLELESRQLLFNIVKGGKSSKGVDCHQQIERTTASITYSLIYGYRLLTGHEPEHARAHEIQKQFAAMMVGPNLVDFIPFLHRIPLPWPWKAKAERHFQEQRDLHMTNLHRALGNPGWNFAKEMAASPERRQMSEEEFAFDLGILADAALETTVISAAWFVVAWLTQDARSGFVARAQRHLDAVVGRDRLPGLDDRPSLPYVDALVEEVLRWRPIGTTGVPHLTKVEDQYEGARIPAGSIVFANQWAIARDAEVFGTKTEEFLPERWLAEGMPRRPEEGAGAGAGASCALRDLPSVGFGFGRRQCTGRHVARSVLWIQITMLLWAFDLDGAVSPETGERVEVDPMAMTDSLVIRPAV